MTARYGTPFDFFSVFFLGIFIHFCQNICISTKFLLIVYLINSNVSKCQKWLQVMECLLILLHFFCDFCTKLTKIHVWCTLSSPKIHKLCIWIWNEYKHLIIIKCQMWLNVMGRSLNSLSFLGIVIHYWRPFMSELLYLNQTFTDFMSNFNFWYVILHQTFINLMESKWY